VHTHRFALGVLAGALIVAAGFAGAVKLTTIAIDRSVRRIARREREISARRLNDHVGDNLGFLRG